MCGIVGLFAKSPGIEQRLGAHLTAMLAQMSNRGPDSAGVAVYRDPAPAGSSKLTLFSADPDEPWHALAGELADAFGGSHEPSVRASHAVVLVDADAAEAEAWVRRRRPELRVMSAGAVIEIYKEVGRPEVFADQFHLTDLQGTHALGHTRMATESRVTTEGSHPFSTGLDLCLVHNGSLSNHNTLRRALRREGIEFQTENDTEVAAGYLTWRLREGGSLDSALEALPRGPRRLLHLRGRHARRLRGAARPDRVQAGRDGRDRRLGGDGVGVPRHRRCCPAPRRPHLGAGARRVYIWEPAARLMVAGSVLATEVVDLAATPLRELNAAAPRGGPLGRRAGALARAEPRRRARPRLRARRRIEVDDRGARRLLLRRHEQGAPR